MNKNNGECMPPSYYECTANVPDAPPQGNTSNQSQTTFPFQYAQTQTLLNPQGVQVNMVTVGDYVPPPAHFDLALMLGCMVCFFFNCIFGSIALCLAVSGLNGRKVGNEKSTDCMLRASYHVSIIGLLLSVWFWLILLALTSGSHTDVCHDFAQLVNGTSPSPNYYATAMLYQ